MDGLDLLKKDWQKKGDTHPKLSYDEIYRMIHKKSSSVVKWIFYISVLELTVPHLIYLFPSARNSMDIYDDLNMSAFLICSSVIFYGIVLIFIYLFYKSYKAISVGDNAKTLMTNILKTRKIVRLYIFTALIMIAVTWISFSVSIYFNPDVLSNFVPENKPELINDPSFKNTFTFIFAILGVVFIALFALIYFLLYGFLLKKLNRNYKELKKLEL